MNKVTLLGRLTSDVELRHTNSQIAVTNFRVAVQRPFKEDGQYKSDFFECVAWKGTAEYVSQYGMKGNRIAVEGRLQNREYNDNSGNRRQVTEIVCDTVEIIDFPKKDEVVNAVEEYNAHSRQIGKAQKAEAEERKQVFEDDLPF